ncbi:hypothetical protein TNCV_3278551 [Trichonephila clavipes]|nr:hypothetical protein TNCV_3278551 [Trichonephila clavipes]
MAFDCTFQWAVQFFYHPISLRVVSSCTTLLNTNSLLRALKSEDSNCLPLSVVRIAGVPKRDTQEEKKASATASAVMSLRGWASGHFENGQSLSGNRSSHLMEVEVQ